MKLIVNVTVRGDSAGDSLIEGYLRGLIEWLKKPIEAVHPTNFFYYSTPMSGDQSFEKGMWEDYTNYDEWKIDVDSELTALCARVLYAEGEIPKGCLEIWVEGEKLDLDDEGFIKPGGGGMWPEINQYLNYIRRQGKVLVMKGPAKADAIN